MNRRRPLRAIAFVRRQARRPLLAVLALIGASCGLAAFLFHAALVAAEEAMRRALLASPAGAARVALAVGIPLLVGAALGALVPRFMPRGGGLALVRGAYAKDPRRLDGRAVATTFVATPLSLGSGAPLGPEGPTVVLTSSVAVGLGRLLGMGPRVERGLIPVGVAAGIAAIFNTPIAGVLFALEEIIGTASRGVLGGAIVAAVAAAVVQKQLGGGHHLLPAAPATWAEPWEFAGFTLLGLAAGLTAGWVPRLVNALHGRLRARWPKAGGRDGAARGALAGAWCGLLGLLAPEILGTGYHTIGAFLHGAGEAHTAGLAFFAKLAGFVLALAAPLFGGAFAPSLFLGAALGAALAHGALLLAPGLPVEPAAWALVGMGAFFAGFLRTPITAVVIVFELTGDYGLVTPLMLAVAIASLLARRYSPRTLVESQLAAEGLHDDDEAERDPLGRLM